MIGVDVIDVQMRRLWGGLSRRRHSVEGNPGFARKGGDRPAAVADQMIAVRDDAGERGCHGSAVDLGQHRIEGRALPVAGDEDGNVVLIKARMSGRAAPAFAPFAADRTIGP